MKLAKWLFYASAVGAGVVIALLLAWVAYGWVAKPPVPRSEIISFLGAAVGAAITVAGAIVVNDLSAMRARRENRRHLIEELQEFLDRANLLQRSIYAENPTPEQVKRLKMGLIENCRNVLDSADIFEVTFPRYVNERYDVLDYLLRIRATLSDRFRSGALTCISALRGPSDNPEMFGKVLTEIDGHMMPLRMHLRSALLFLREQ